MVGLFSRFSSSRASHRRAQSAIDEGGALQSNSEGAGASSTSGTAAIGHGIDVAVEFKPVEHPVEPLDNDQPVQCPAPEPSILNDGRIWKERASQSIQRRGDLPVMKEGEALESDSAGKQSMASEGNRMILPSLSAPEPNFLNLLEESGV